jgi:hypothetical protein
MTPSRNRQSLCLEPLLPLAGLRLGCIEKGGFVAILGAPARNVVSRIDEIALYQPFF